MVSKNYRGLINICTVTNPERNSILIEQDHYLSFIHLFINSFSCLLFISYENIYIIHITYSIYIHNFRIKEQIMTKNTANKKLTLNI